MLVLSFLKKGMVMCLENFREQGGAYEKIGEAGGGRMYEGLVEIEDVLCL